MYEIVPIRSARPSGSNAARTRSRTVRAGRRAGSPRGSGSSRGLVRPRQVAADHLLDRPLQRVGEVAAVADRRERAARPEHAVDLGQRPLEVEPVERRGGGDRVGRAVRERDLLGRSGERLGPGHRRRELGAHLGERLDRDHPRAGRHELARQLPGAGADVDHGRPGAEPEPRRQPVDDRRRVRRPAPLVALGDRAEGRGRGAVERHAQYAPRLASTAGSVFARIEMSSPIDQFSR